MSTFKTLVDAMASVVANSNSNRAADINNIQNALKDIVSGYSTGTLVNPQQIIVVAKAKGDFTSLASAAAAIIDASASKPYAILLKPGIYETSEVTLPDYVSVVGSDINACVLSTTAANKEYTIAMGNYSCISNVSIRNSTTIAGSQYPTGIYVYGKTNVSIINCDISVTPTYTSGIGAVVYGIFSYNASNIIVRGVKMIVNPSGSFTSVSGVYLGGTTYGKVTDSHIQVLGNIVGSRGLRFLSTSTTGIYIMNSIIECVRPVIGITGAGLLIVENCFLKATANNEYTVAIEASNSYFYGCTVLKHGTATECFETSTTQNVRIAHCRMNLASPIHAGLTNLIATPSNVMDTDV